MFFLRGVLTGVGSMPSAMTVVDDRNAGWRFEVGIGVGAGEPGAGEPRPAEVGEVI